ncbi:hypothetical protein ACHQM5_009317 [Ranunculus cassubicifolius]
MESEYDTHTHDHHTQEDPEVDTPTYEFSVSYQDTQPNPQQAPPRSRSIPGHSAQKPQDSDSDSDSDKETKPRPQARPTQGYTAQPPTNFPPQAIPQQFPPQATPQQFPPQANPQQFPPQAQYYQTQQAQPQNFPQQPSPQPAYTKPPPNTPYNQNGVPMYQQNAAPVYQQGGVPMYQTPAQGYVPQQSPYAPRAYPTNTGTVGWSTGLFDCMDDPTNAVITACCPCFTFGQIAEIIDNGHTTCATSGILYGCIAAFIGVPCLISCGYRSKLRSKYDLIEVPAADWITHCFCEWCALCQEYRELKNRGLDPAIGWQGNMMKNQGMQQQQGAMMMPPGQHMMK